MDAGAHIPEPEELFLSRLAELDMAAAEHVHARLMAAEAAAEVAELGRTYQRFARSLRQTLALKAKLKRDREAALKTQPPAKPGGVAVARRLRDLRTALVRIAWDEAEGSEDAGYYEEAIEERLAIDCLGDDFCAEPLDDHVARLCLELGLPPDAAMTWRDLPDPPDDDSPAGDEPAHRSSG